ncbi:hypothetical protein sce6931 [Sorangium cellulosum So ce56]|uniref:TolC family protein n=1 Tax=Sorangium cellulosum (strain So ce56) TaxID=448385 RepID=A9GXI8_SORC5|nr:hypothetical protein [Sorangium cellulosum]CAN97100.1 hypothetical protein sce6931 [Sorangium cellulosum So ce56]
MHPNHRSITSSALFLLGALACALFTRQARAELPLDDEPTALDPRVDRLDTAPHELWAASPGGAQPLWLAVELGIARLEGGERSLTGMLLASIPLERLSARPGAPSPPSAVAEPAAPRLKPAPATPSPPRAAPEIELPEPPPPAQPAEVEPPLPLPVRVTPAMARAIVEAALRKSRLLDPEARIDAIASRARTSSLFPELRLRVSRLVDEAESLAPTEYDPARKTASGGTSLWLEARATWRLDRIVFADEEIALERLRRERAELQTKLTARVLELLFAWQRAVALAADPGQSPEEHRAATLAALEAEASLDLLTGGWMTRWRAARE